jgi:hypothetical protein
MPGCRLKSLLNYSDHGGSGDNHPVEDMHNDSDANTLARRTLTREQENLGRLRRLFDKPVVDESNLRLAV